MHQHGYCRSFLQTLSTLVRYWVYLPTFFSALAWFGFSSAISRVSACIQLVSGHLQCLFISNESLKAPTTQFGRLPDAVLLHIFKDYCDADTQQTAYQSCKGIRDFCNRNIKSVWVHIYKAKKLDATRNVTSSSNICPRGSHGIEKLLVHLDGHAPDTDDAFKHLEQLICNTFNADMPGSRGQLQNISSIEVMLPWGTADLTEQQQQIVSRLLAHCHNLQSLSTNNCCLLACAPLAKLKQVHMKRSRITPEQLRCLAEDCPQLQKLEFTIGFNTQPASYQPSLLSMKALEHLYVASGTASRKPVLAASMFTGLTQLTNLTIKDFVLHGAHLLAQLSLVHLTLINVRLEQVAKQQQPAAWPSLKSFQFVHPLFSQQDYVITESTARAILPVPRPGFSVTWPMEVMYDADVPPHPLYGYKGAAHMTSFNELQLIGTHVRAALQFMVEKQVPIQSLLVLDRMSLKPEDVATYFAFPYVVRLQLPPMVAVTPEFVTRLLQQCPTLETLTLCEPPIQQREQLDQSVTALGYSCSYNGMTATVTRPCCDEVSRQRQAAERLNRYGNILETVDASTLPACTLCGINKLDEDGTYAK